jgi:tRNA(Ile)-lysidine synthase
LTEGNLALPVLMTYTINMKENMVQNVLSTIRHHHMVQPHDQVLVAVSGGPDSVCLLHVLLTLRSELDCSLKAIHIDHGLRKESTDEAGFVRDLCLSWGIECLVRKVDVDNRLANSRDSVEMAARYLRYQEFHQALQELGCNKLALGHNADDQAETVVMRIIKGTGTSGLAGIFPVRERMIRPLLTSWRSSIERYCQEHSLPTVVDQSNLTNEYLRNKIRHLLLPHLEKEYNPRIKEALCRLAEIIREDSTYLDETAKSVFYSETVSGEIGKGFARMKAGGLGELPLAMARSVFRYAYIASTNQLPPSFERMEAALVLTQKGAPSGTIIQLGKNTSVCKKGKWLEIYIEKATTEDS